MADVSGPIVGGFTESELEPGMQIVFEAIDPTTGAAVAGVTVSAIGILASGEGSHIGDGDFGPFMLVPGPGA